MHLPKLTELCITKNEFLKTKKQKQHIEKHKNGTQTNKNKTILPMNSITILKVGEENNLGNSGKHYFNWIPLS